MKQRILYFDNCNATYRKADLNEFFEKCVFRILLYRWKARTRTDTYIDCIGTAKYFRIDVDVVYVWVSENVVK